MILSRRKAHFWMISGLACVLPIVFIMGLILRPAIPTVGETTDSLFATDSSFETSALQKSNQATKTLSVTGIEVQVETVASHSGSFLTLQPMQPLQFSDVLVYWVKGDNPLERPDQNAILLGQLSGTRRRQFPIPPNIKGQVGQLLFYSGGTNTAIATVIFPDTLP